MFQKKINEIINGLYIYNPNILAIFLVSKEGGSLKNTWPTIYNQEKDIAGVIAEFSVNLLESAESISFIKVFLSTAGNRRAGAIEFGSFQEIILTGRYIQAVIIGAGSQDFLIVYTNQKEIDKSLLQAIRNSAEEIEKIDKKRFNPEGHGY